MAQTTYTYSITNDISGGAVNITNLVSDIQNSGIVTALDYVNSSGDTLNVVFKDALSVADKLILDGQTEDDVLDIQVDNTLDPGATPTTGDRYLITDSTNLHLNFGVIVGLDDNDIVEHNGVSFIIDFDSSGSSSAITKDLDSDRYQTWNATTWSVSGAGGLLATHDTTYIPTDPPVTQDGDWHFVNENFAHVTGNEGINWTVEKFLEPGESYSEKLILPDSRHATLNFVEGGSSIVSTTIRIEWYEEVDTDVYMRFNPWIRVDEVCSLEVNGAHNSGATVINVNNGSNQLDDIETGYYYGFKDGTNNTVYHKITAKDTGADTITISPALTANIADLTCIGLTDRVVGRRGNQVASSILNWTSPPNKFLGNGKNYFILSITNEDTIDSALVSATLNGWHTNTVAGD